MKRWKHLFCCLMAAVLGIAALPVTAVATPRKTVRIGLYNRDDYHMIDDYSRHSGYDHEYLLEISKYTGWEYEAVEGTWQECVTMLENGEIDLLGGMDRNEVWQNISYAEESSAHTTNCLLIDETSNRYAYEDFEAFDGMRIGVMKESAITRNLDQYAEENHFSYVLVPFETQEELNTALKQDQIDCIGLSDFHNLSTYKIIARFDNTPRYYAVNANRPDLKAELDYALEKIHQQNKFYEAQLYEKYFSTAQRIAFSKEEMEYLEKHPIVQVALFSNIPQICEYDESTGEYTGFIFDILDLLSEKTGITFAYMEIPEDVTPWDFLYEHPNVLLAPLFQNELIHYSERMRFLDTIVPGKMVAVVPEKSVSKTAHLSRDLRLAIPKGMFGASQELYTRFPGCELIFCDSHEEGMEMVRRGEADMTIVNEILGTYLMQSPYYAGLNIVYLNEIMENVTIGMGSSSDALLMSILNKVIHSFSQSDIQQLVIEYASENPYQKDAGELLYEYWQLILLGMLGLLVAYAFWHLYSRQRKAWMEQIFQLKVAEEQLKIEEKYQTELFRQANFDELTGAYNQRYFLEKANDLLREHPDVVYSFFHINFSNFKLINELYGMQQGDAVLQIAAAKLKQMVGKNGIYGRLYADQFVACYPLSEEQIAALPEIQTLFYMDIGGQMIHVQSKVGVYINDKHIRNASQAITYARIALQSYETPRGNHVYFYQDSYLDRMLTSQNLTNEMERALQEGQFRVYLQPQYNIRSGELVSAEALARWIHPTKGCISPGVFIPVFEGNGFASRLDMYMIEQVCMQMAEWKKQGRMIPVSVNLSRLDLEDRDLLQKITEILDTYEIPVPYLHLEITESAYVENRGAFYPVIEEMRQAGFVIEMDDFGSGYSSLNMLKELPVDVLKLDMKFFSGESHMDKGGNIVESIVELAHKLNLLVVAEGVETEREANFLRSIDCLIIQGYLYGRPMPVAEFDTLLQKSTLGDKMQAILADRRTPGERLYWELEQLHILLRQSGVILFDYDPTEVEMTEEGAAELWQNYDLQKYCKNLPKNFRVHPDCYQVILDALYQTSSEPAEVDFLADADGNGIFSRFHATVYYYQSHGRLNRIIGMIVAAPPSDAD